MSTAGLPDVVKEAIERYKIGSAATEKQRKRETEALKFQVPELQWSEDARGMRKSQTVNGGVGLGDISIPARPMLSIPKLDQPIQLTLNQERAAQLSVKVHPLNEQADKDNAEMRQELYRHIEVDSRANLARSWAHERAVKAGRGAYRVLKAYDETGGHPSDQKILISRILYQEAVVLDPFAQEPDWCDGDWGMVAVWVPWSRFKRAYPTSQLVNYSSNDFGELEKTTPDWIKGEGEARAVLVVEYFRKVYRTRTKVALDDGSEGYDDDIPEGRTIAGGDGAYNRKVEDWDVKWSKLTAVEELENGDWEGRYIPIIPTVGRELIPFDGERRYMGMIEPNMDGQRMFNYAASGLAEISTLETKASHTVDPKQIEGYEAWWQQKNIRNFPYLPARRIVGGVDVGPPMPIQVDTARLNSSMMMLQQASDFLHAGTGAFEPTLGQNSPNVKTKGQTLALQAQHEQGNSNWIDNLAEISMTYEAKVVLDLLPHVYDRPGRIQRLLGNEDEPKMVMLNAPFVMQNGQPMPAPPSPAGQPLPEGVKHYDLKKGRYGVTVDIGKGKKSRLEEGSDSIGQLLQAAHELIPVLGPEWMKFQDFPGSRNLYEILKKMRDHQFPWLADEKDGEAAQATQKLQQAEQQVQQMGEQLKQAADIIKTEQVKQQAQVAIAKIKESATLQGKVMDNATKIAVARITAAKGALDEVREDQEEALALNQQQAHDASQAQQDRAHEVAMAAQEHQHALEAAQQAHEQASAQAEQGAGLQAGLADQGQQHALEQGQQAADLAPEPAQGDA